MTRLQPDPVRILPGDCLAVLPTLTAGSVDAVVTDPPYELGFMGRAWDRTGVAFGPATWAAVLRVLKPGGYMVAMGGSRTYHRLTCAIEDAGFEVRDCLMWLYGTGFPKGRGCLKPAYEPIVLARKPGPRVLPLGIDGCRVPFVSAADERESKDKNQQPRENHDPPGRYPANVLHDGGDEVMGAFAVFGERDSGGPARRASGTYKRPGDGGGYQGVRTADGQLNAYADAGTAARFFYCAKASKSERDAGLEDMPAVACGTMQDDAYRWERDGHGNPVSLNTKRRNTHPTVKPLALMRWLVRIVCPPGGVALDPFAGSGTTGLAAVAEGRRAVLVERNPQYVEIIRRRVAAVEPQGLFAGAV